jgi:hypothetical protein
LWNGIKKERSDGMMECWNVGRMNDKRKNNYMLKIKI